MINDPIVAEVRRAREKLFAECGNDLGRLFERLRETEGRYRDRLVTKDELMRRRAAKAANQSR